jgi:hypothetical protein
MHISFKIIKFLFHFMLLDMFRAPLCPSSGASYCCTCILWSPCGVESVVSSSLVLLLLPTAGNVVLLLLPTAGNVVLLLLPTAVTTEQGWRKQLTQHHTVTRDCMCSNKKLLMMDTMVSETCRAA